ncbi:MAG: hypothetical protein ABSE63_04225 [Thermoguttaceae bacterium]|jgi:hypothetical protein
MKINLPVIIIALFACADLAMGQFIDDPARIKVDVPPYYNSKGPTINVGPFSNSLASKSEPEFVATISKMKQSWNNLKFTEMYVAAICLYDRGYRKEAVYWFYSAQYRGRLFGILIDREKMGGLGDPAFELFHTQNAFYQLVGPYINGYAFGDIDYLMEVIERVQKEGLNVPDLNKIYPGVLFKKTSEWKPENKNLNQGMTSFLATLKEQKGTLKQQRIEGGIEAKFSKLTNKELATKLSERSSANSLESSSP